MKFLFDIARRTAKDIEACETECEENVAFYKGRELSAIGCTTLAAALTSFAAYKGLPTVIEEVGSAITVWGAAVSVSLSQLRAVSDRHYSTAHDSSQQPSEPLSVEF